MGDSACLMPATAFSYASPMPHEPIQGNPMKALGESISFGRFMTEPLSWEKWSTFSSHKKYVEEAERYAKPGSVAQKKAFFEAHYKRIAAQKAAALLEEANAANNTVENAAEKRVDVDGGNHYSHTVGLNFHFAVDEKPEGGKIMDAKIDAMANGKECGDSGAERSEEVGKFGGTALPKENMPPVETPQKRNSISQNEKLENQDTISGSETSGTPQMERPLLKQNTVANQDDTSATSKKRSALSSLKSSIHRKTSKVPWTPAKQVTNLKKEKTPSTRKSNEESTDKKNSSPKSLLALMNLIPAKEHDKVPLPATQKIQSSGVASNSIKGSKDCKTPLRTPVVAASKEGSKYPSATPRSEKRGAKTPLDHPASGSKTTGPKWHILSAVCSKSLTACRNKLQSPTLSTPFLLRTEERAAKRKQKLEEKFNAKEEVQKVQLQTKLKEKAGSEFRKLGQSLCFKARPLPEFYKEREKSKNQINKNPVVQPQSAVLGGKPRSSKTQGTHSMPPLTRASSARNDASKNVSRKNVHTKLPERITHENKSPNIRQ